MLLISPYFLQPIFSNKAGFQLSTVSSMGLRLCTYPDRFTLLPSVLQAACWGKPVLAPTTLCIPSAGEAAHWPA